MPRTDIKVLDSVTIDRIAAGEVIERPASVIKELVENGLDAGARTLRIEIADGGLASLRVEDDGHGIPFRHLPLAFERHATSKIASAADIMQVGTFGFRGEALASIASVSKCQLVSRAADEELGGLIVINGGETKRREPAPRNQGTTVEVSDLFWNTPARRKYLGTPAAEKRAVVALITSLALAHPEVRWLLRCDGQDTLDLLPVDSLPARARDLLGAACVEHLSRFDFSEGGLSAGGLASRPTWTRGNRTQQFIYVNRRPIQSRTLSHAIAQAYHDVIPPGRHPVVLLFLQIPAGDVDVNVHPAKTEVRLLLERRIFSLVRNAIQEGLNLRAESPIVRENDLGESPPVSGDAIAPDSPLAGLARAESDFLGRHFGSADSDHRGTMAIGDQGELFSGRPAATGPDSGTSLRQAPFWQLHRTYILTQIRGGLVIIDQHNSHERILYNEASRALGEGHGIPTQQLLFPAHLDLSPNQVQSFHEQREALERLGFTIQPFGGQSILVQGIPGSLKNWAEGQLLLDMLDDLTEPESSGLPDQKALLASYACHGAVRAGELLTVPEMQNLVDQLFATDLPLSCPHGRPTLIQYSLPELEKRFGRR
ncbi:MAG: DNA mismatch repair endonuclease MutL [bacterium]